MTRFPSIMAIAIAGLSGCCAAPRAELPFRMTPAGRVACAGAGDPPALVLEVPAHSSSADDAANLRTRCQDQRPDARSYRFTPPRTATYRFRMHADYPAGMSIGNAQTHGWDSDRIATDRETVAELRVTLREGTTYPVAVWSKRAVEPPTSLDLAVELDESADARIRPEDPALVARLIAGAPELARHTLGTFESVPGGPRARCGGLGGGAVYAIDVAAAGTLGLHAVAQFPVAIELRDRAGGSIGCARADPEQFDVALRTTVVAGAYVVIIDSTEPAPELVSPHDVKLPGAGVRGAFALDVDATP